MTASQSFEGYFTVRSLVNLRTFEGFIPTLILILVVLLVRTFGTAGLLFSTYTSYSGTSSNVVSRGQTAFFRFYFWFRLHK